MSLNIKQVTENIYASLQNIETIAQGNSKTFVNEFLKDGSNINANSNYSGSVTDFKYVANENNTKITRMIVFIRDTGGGIDVTKYGNITGGLNIGIKTYIKPSGQAKIYLHSDLPIMSNGNWGAICYDSEIRDTIVSVRWTFNKSGTSLILQNQDEFGVELNDDLSGLNEHYFLIQGNK